MSGIDNRMSSHNYEMTRFLMKIHDQDELEKWYNRVKKIYDLKWFHGFSFEQDFNIYIDFEYDALDMMLVGIIEQLIARSNDQSLVLINEDGKQHLVRQNVDIPDIYNLKLEDMKRFLKKDRYNYLDTKRYFVYNFAVAGTSGKWLVYIPTVDNDVRVGDNFYNVEFTLFAIHKTLDKEFKKLFKQNYGKVTKLNNSKKFEMIKKIFHLEPEKNDIFFSKESFIEYKKDNYGYFAKNRKMRRRFD